jgi:hypothetical protein
MMMKKRKSNAGKLLLGAALAVAVIGFAGCPNSADENKGGGTKTGVKLTPEKPTFTGSQGGFEVLDLAGDAEADANLGGVVALTWRGEGALEYNVYWSEESARPHTPNISGLKDQVCFARNLQEDTEYYFWVEAKNPNGSTFSDPFSKTTGKKGPYSAGGVERGDYPRNMRVVPGNGSLTVTWNLSDRVGWYEIYYAEAGEVNHVDAYTPLRFKWDDYFDPQNIITPQGRLAISYVEYTGNENPNDWPHAVPFGTSTYYFSGYTRPIYPFCSPLAANGGYEGYHIGEVTGIDGDTRPVVGQDEFGESFPYIFESWKEGDKPGDLGRLQPYQTLDAAFANAIPWDAANNSAGPKGTTIKSFTNTVTITGLTNDKTYEVWVRCPNANGERGYGYVTGTPEGGAALAAPATVQVTAPAATTRNLIVSWSRVSGAENYRIYVSRFNYTPNVTMSYETVNAPAVGPLVYTLSNLKSDSDYYVWVVAERNGLPGIFGKPAMGRTGKAPAVGHIGDKIIVGTGAKVKTAVYVEVNDRNPLNAGSYILEDGTYLFDYVIIFAANIRNRNCTTDLDYSVHRCGKSGPHLHLNDNVRYVLENRTKYIKPLQDKGIKVLLGLLGDHDGIGFGTMNDADRATFVADLAKVVKDYGLDGVDFDDEWASKEAWNMDSQAANPTAESIWTYPVSSWGWPFNMTIYRNPEMGIVPGNGTITAPSQSDQDRMWAESGDLFYKTVLATRNALPSPYIICLYEYNTGRYITAGGANNPTPGSTATMTGLGGAVDFTLQPWYNQYIADSANGLPRSMYSPFGVDLSGNAYASFGGTAYPPISIGNSETAVNTVRDYSTRFLNSAAGGNAYNVLYFYGLEEVSRLVKRQTNDPAPTVSREDYISRITGVIFGQNCMLTAEGGDFRKDW